MPRSNHKTLTLLKIDKTFDHNVEDEVRKQRGRKEEQGGARSREKQGGEEKERR